MLRLWKKAIILALRSRKRYFVFTMMYTALLFWSSYSLHISSVQTTTAVTSFLIAMGISIFLSLLYAWVITNYRRREIATLKCIGYTNRDCKTIIIGEILFATISGFIIVIEVLFHFVAALGYFYSAVNPSVPSSQLPLISLPAVLLTFGIFVSVQLIGILLANRRVLRVRPIIALKKVGT